MSAQIYFDINLSWSTSTWLKILPGRFSILVPIVYISSIVAHDYEHMLKRWCFSLPSCKWWWDGSKSGRNWRRDKNRRCWGWWRRIRWPAPPTNCLVRKSSLGLGPIVREYPIHLSGFVKIPLSRISTNLDVIEIGGCSIYFLYLESYLCVFRESY